MNQDDAIRKIVALLEEIIEELKKPAIEPYDCPLLGCKNKWPHEHPGISKPDVRRRMCTHETLDMDAGNDKQNWLCCQREEGHTGLHQHFTKQWL